MNRTVLQFHPPAPTAAEWCVGLADDELDRLLFQQPGLVQQGRLLLERKRRYELAHPETVKGVAQANSTNKKLGRGDATAESALTFTAYVKKEHGWSARKTEKIIERALGIHPDVLDQVEGTKLEKGVVLDRLLEAGKGAEDCRAAQMAVVEVEEPQSEVPENPLFDGFLKLWAKANERQQNEGGRLIAEFLRGEFSQ